MRPILFSEHFKIGSDLVDEAGLLDPYINTDTPLFIDPLLLDKSENEILANRGLAEFRTHFDSLIRLLIMSESESDPAWLAAERHLSLNEPAENGLGYSRKARAGTSRPKEIRTQLLRTVKKVVRLGSKDPEMLSLMGFLESGVGSDTISDFTTRAMTGALGEITHTFCVSNQIEVHENDLCPYSLPTIMRNGKSKPVVLVPRDVLRHLPVTDGWKDVWAVTEHNRLLRERLSVMLAGIVEPTIKEQKEAIKSAVMQSSTIFDEFLSAVKSAAASYDENDDIMGFYALRRFLLDNPLPAASKSYDLRKGPAEVLRVVLDSVALFKHHVEHGNLWETLWAGNQPKRERASQLMFYPVADAYCRANNVDLSSEPNMGGGPVDFSFSDGYAARVVVEFKKSDGAVESGYKRQLERYKKAALTDFGVFVVIDYGKAGRKIANIKKWREFELSQGRRASDIIVIDASKKPTASKM